MLYQVVEQANGVCSCNATVWWCCRFDCHWSTGPQSHIFPAHCLTYCFTRCRPAVHHFLTCYSIHHSICCPIHHLLQHTSCRFSHYWPFLGLLFPVQSTSLIILPPLPHPSISLMQTCKHHNVTCKHCCTIYNTGVSLPR